MHAAEPASQAPVRTRRKRGKVLLIVGGGVVLSLAVLVALAPTIAGRLAPGIIAQQAARHVQGAVLVEGASFSWGGPQRVGPIIWNDPQGQQVAKLSVSTSAGLVGLATGGLDLGEVNVRDASVRVVRAADGTLNVRSLLVQQPGAGAAPGQAAPGKPAQAAPRLPAGLKVRLRVDQLDATLIDQTAGTTRTAQLSNVKVQADVDPTQPLRVDATLDASAAPSAGQAAAAPGSVTINLRATDWAQADGQITPDKAQVDATIDVASIPTALIDALVGPLGDASTSVSGALGPALAARVVAKGSLEDATAQLSVAMDRLSAAGSLRVAQGVASVAQPLRVEAKGEALTALARAFSPAVARALSPDAFARIDALPDATLALDQLALTLPKGGQPLDLRGMKVDATLTLADVRGRAALAQGQAPQALAISPTTLGVRSDDLAQGARVTVRTSATLGGRNAGDVAADVRVGGLLDARGAIRGGLPSSIDGTVDVRNAATAVAQPFVQGLGLDLTRDVGPNLDLALRAATTTMPQGVAGTAGNATVINLDLDARAQHLTAVGALALSEAALATREQGVRITADNAGRIARALTTNRGGWSVREMPGSTGELVLTIAQANLPLAPAQPGAPSAQGPLARAMFDKARLDASFTLRGMEAARADSANASALRIESAEGSLGLDGAGTLAHRLRATTSFEGRPGSVGADVQVAELFIAGPGLRLSDPLGLRPKAKVEVANLPIEALALVLPAPAAPMAAADPSAPVRAPLDMVAMAREVLGGSLAASITTEPWDAGVLSFVVSISGNAGGPEGTTVLTGGQLTPDALNVGNTSLRLALSPALLEQLLVATAPDLSPRPRLASVAVLRGSVQPISVPIDAQKRPQLEKAGVLKATLGIPGDALVDNLPAGEGRTLRLGARGLSIDIEAPLPALLPAQPGAAPASPGQARAALTGDLSLNDRALAKASAGVTTALSSGKPAGTMQLEATLAGLDPATLDAALGRNGMLAGLLGASAEVGVQAQLEPSMTGTLGLSLASPQLRSEGPLSLRLASDRIELGQPARLAIDAQPAFLNALLAPKQPGAQAALTVVAPASISLRLDTLVLPRGQRGAAPDAAGELTIPTLALRTSDAKDLRLTGAKAQVRTDASVPGRALRFELGVEDAAVAGAPGSGALALGGALSNIARADGSFDTTNAVLDATGAMPSMPTALLDVLARQDGLLVDLLGPVIDVRLNARALPLAAIGPDAAARGAQLPPGSLEVKATSPRASLDLAGDVKGGVVTASRPMQAGLTEVTNALAGRFLKGLPLLGSFEKSPADAPAVLRAEGLTFPLGNDFRQLNGTFRLDPGEAKFGASGAFGQLLNMAGLRESFAVGRRLEPLVVNVREGVATYDKWTVPIGEFNVQTEGRVDLVQQQIDVITWVPLGALAESTVGLLNRGLPGVLGGATPVLDRLSLIPFRTRGPLGKSSTGIDFKLLGEGLLRSINPGKLIEEGLGGLLRGIGNRRDGQPGQQPGQQPPQQPAPPGGGG